MDARASLGEGNTPLVEAGPRLATFSGLERLWLKNETQNPTGSFKDRGSLTCVFMARERGEPTLATVSTGNMGHSIAAYAARSGLRALVFVPEFAPREKLLPMTLHGATVIKVRAPDYALMKQTVLGLAGEFNLRIVSGNGPIRVEGYKLTAFELYEQTRGELPDYIAVPTSACGHLRGLFKGFRELQAAGLIRRCPRMIVVQAANNSPIVATPPSWHRRCATCSPPGGAILSRQSPRSAQCVRCAATIHSDTASDSGSAGSGETPRSRASDNSDRVDRIRSSARSNPTSPRLTARHCSRSIGRIGSVRLPVVTSSRPCRPRRNACEAYLVSYP